MIVLALLSGIIAFALFAAATDEHHQRRLGGRPSRARKQGLRRAAWVAVVTCLILAIVARGWVYGPVTWFGLVMLGAGLVFLFINLLPTSIRRDPS